MPIRDLPVTRGYDNGFPWSTGKPFFLQAGLLTFPVIQQPSRRSFARKERTVANQADDLFFFP